ncbi:MFS transporter [Afipia sp. P52-10]|uniref:Bug family tripartite tricarboxylate transporter substrate binding protein n=1 Tax=Afipia sp. P52-10 TaxID=1429916 RepID=UPI0003DF3FDA|nr:tripartite tricarboxylate transporter substrate binding protein [Afipia sp. P52-10]ETR75422.1 MFS transporter [Afipia sp. P52-10]
MMNFHKTLAGALLLAALASNAAAQDFPNRPVTWVVPFTPGGVTDTGARVVAKAFSETLGVSVIVENKGGAGGIVGTEFVAQSKPDGYTILYGSSGPMATNPYLYKKISYDPLKSFSLIHTMSESPMIMVVNPNTPYKTVAEFVEYAKKNPNKINFGSSGAGTSPHLVGELLQQEAGIKLTHVPYKGSSPAVVDLLAGTVDVMFDYAVVVKPHIDSGKLRALAVTSSDRMKILPTIPTLKESGYPNAVLAGWSTIVAAKDTPQPIVDKLAKAFGEALKKPEVVSYFETNGSAIMPPLTGDKLTEFMVSENKKFKGLVEKSGASAE